jgi:hypothetical protein
MPSPPTIDICVGGYNFQPYGFIFVIAPITSKRTFDSISNGHYHSLLGVAKMVYQAPQIFVETLVILGIQLTIVFCQIATLCKGGGTSRMMVTPKDHLVSMIIS